MKNEKENTVLNGVIDIVCDVMELTKEEVTPEANLVTDLNVESLDFVDLVEAFTKEYNVAIHDKDLKEINTVKDIADYIEAHENA